MGGTLMWVILGSLIGLVIIFLIVTSFLDKKKRNQTMKQKSDLEAEINVSSINVAKKIKKIISNNTKELKSFVPSVGKKKMSDINNKAKNGLLDIKDSREFKLIKNNETEWELFSKNIKSLIAEKSNNWDKRLQKEMKFFITFEETIKVEKEKNAVEDKKNKKVKKVK